MKTLQLQITLNEDAEKLLVELFARALLEANKQPQVMYEARQAAGRWAPQQPIFAGKKRPDDPALLIDTRTVAKLLNVCVRTFEKMRIDGRLPPPIKIGSAVRWSYPAIKKWVDDGGPCCDSRLEN